MGFWGSKAFARAGSVANAPELISTLLGGELDSSWVEPTGWTFASLHDAPYPDSAQVARLASELGGPVLVAYIADSDFAVLQFTAPGLELRSGVLHTGIAAEMGYEDIPTPEETCTELVRWSGTSLDEAAVIRALNQNLTFAEDTFLVLADAVGALAPGALEQYLFGSLDPEE